MILKHVGWSFVVFGSILMSNFWRVHCTQVSDSGPLGLLLESLFLSHSVIFYHDIKVFIMFYSCSASKESVQAENWYRFQRQLCGKRQDCSNHQVTASQGHSLQNPVCSHDINICIPILQDIWSENSRWSNNFPLLLYVFMLRKPLNSLLSPLLSCDTWFVCTDNHIYRFCYQYQILTEQGK